MILLDPFNFILKNVLTEYLSAEKHEMIDMTIADFDGVLYHVVSAPEKDFLIVSVSMPCLPELRKNGAEGMLKAVYKDWLREETEEGYDLSLQIALDNVGETEKLINRFSLLKRNLLGAPLRMGFDGKQKEKVVAIHYREDETMFIIPEIGRTTVIFSICFKDPDDVVISKVFLQEFQDARRNLQNVPPVSYVFREAPLELKDVEGVQEGDNVGFVTFVLFDRNTAGAQKEKTITMIQMFRDYLHYHIKASKGYMHMRMRAKVVELLKVLNRAKPEDPTKEKKTASGRTFKRK